MTALAPRLRQPAPIGAFRFDLGQTVRLGEMPAIVTGRLRSMMGREMYHIEVMGAASGRPHRTALGTALEPIGEDPREALDSAGSVPPAERAVLLLSQAPDAFLRAA